MWHLKWAGGEKGIRKNEWYRCKKGDVSRQKEEINSGSDGDDDDDGDDGDDSFHSKENNDTRNFTEDRDEREVSSFSVWCPCLEEE